MAKAPSRIDRVKALMDMNAKAEEAIADHQKAIEGREGLIKSLREEVMAEYVCMGGVRPSNQTPPMGSISSRHNLQEGDLIVAQGQTWAGSTVGTVVIFKEITGNNDIRAWTNHSRTTTDYGRGFLLLARPVQR